MNKKARHQSRILALQAVFAYLSRGSEDMAAMLTDVLNTKPNKVPDDFSLALCESVEKHLAKLKVVIRAYASDFRYEKIAPINRSILLLGLAEMKYFETPPVVVINEYIELAKVFGEERSPAFINGVLDQFRKNIGA